LATSQPTVETYLDNFPITNDSQEHLPMQPSITNVIPQKTSAGLISPSKNNTCINEDGPTLLAIDNDIVFSLNQENYNYTSSMNQTEQLLICPIDRIYDDMNETITSFTVIASDTSQSL